MKKIIVSTICLLLIGIKSVFASGDGFTSVANENELKECLKTKSACKLESDITATSLTVVEKNVILDLSGHKIIASSNLNLKSGLLSIDRGAKLDIHDSVGTGKISTGDNTNVYAAITMVNDNNKEGIAELVVNGGTLEGYYYGIAGNGSKPNTKITINKGNINALNKSDSVGIYHPENGTLEINGGTISGGTGIEIRSGSLTVNNGTIKGISPTFNRTANSNGSTTNGAGITVAQHTTKNPINVVVNNGDISGQYAFYEWNPQNNSKSDLEKIKINIKGGNFVSTIEDGYAVYSEDFKNFISGGKFNTGVSEYLTEDAKVETTMSEALEVKNSKHIVPYLVLSVVALGSLTLYILYKKKIISNPISVIH